ncbi:hypothetical protein F750_6653 [Streptomyces sp. PAMC 26508]|nr:hypothetical protein F750_6653 [Streptomyces sp. PAMC 26508]
MRTIRLRTVHPGLLTGACRPSSCRGRPSGRRRMIKHDC